MIVTFDFLNLVHAQGYESCLSLSRLKKRTWKGKWFIYLPFYNIVVLLKGQLKSWHHWGFFGKEINILFLICVQL